MARNAVHLELSAAEVAQLNGWQSAHGTAQQVALRCRLVLAAADGKKDGEIATAFRVSRHTASLWRRRVHEKGIGAVWEIEKGRGRKPQLDQARRDAIIAATLETKPAGATHWSCRDMAEAQGVSKNTVNRLWQLHNLKPHLSRTFKLSRDPKFVEKLTDVVGLYLNPPEKMLVLCVDEKSRIQALDRTQPGLPMEKGRCGTMTHDYKRNGTTTLFAAMSVLDGKVVGQCQPRHRHQEFLKFLRLLDREFPGKRELHLILDNYGTHKTPEVQAWLKKHRRFVPHFIPTSSSFTSEALAIEYAVRMIADVEDPNSRTNRRRLIVLISNIYGVGTRYADEPIIRRLWDQNIVLSVIDDAASTASTTSVQRSSGGESQTILFRRYNPIHIAQATGGDRIVAMDPRHPGDLLTPLRQRYTLWFNQPSDASPGESRTIQVDLSEAARRRFPDAVIKAREGYVTR